MGTDFIIDERDQNHQRDINMITPGANPPFVANNENSLQSYYNYKLDSRDNSHENNLFGV